MLIKRLLERNALSIAVLFTIVIALLSLVSLKGVHLIKTSNSDKLGHFIAYFLLCISWLNAAKFFPFIKYKTVLIILFLISYGIILEVLQDVLTTYRQADLFDIISNSAGVIFAVILYNLLKKKT